MFLCSQLVRVATQLGSVGDGENVPVATSVSIGGMIPVPVPLSRCYMQGAAGGLLAPVIPPSMLFIIYGVLAQIPIGDMFLAGIIHGMMMFLGFVAVITVIGWISPLPRKDWMSARESVKALVESLPAALIPASIISAILFDVATPTESAAIASVIAFLLGKFAFRHLKFSDLSAVFVRTARNSALVIYQDSYGQCFWLGHHLRGHPAETRSAHHRHRCGTFCVPADREWSAASVGMLIDGIAAIILVIPILLPIAMGSYGISPYQFGVVISINLILRLLTLPVGVGLYIASAMSEVKPVQIFRALWPFLLATLIVLLLFSRFPGLSTALI